MTEVWLYIAATAAISTALIILQEHYIKKIEKLEAKLMHKEMELSEANARLKYG